MEPPAVLDALVELAQDAGLKVRVAPRSAARDGEPLLESGLCRLRGEWWLVLSAGEPIEARIRTAAQAVRQHAGSEWLEARYVPPALRQWLDSDPV